MSPIIQRHLARAKSYGPLFELIATNGTDIFTLGYSDRISPEALGRMCRKRKRELLSHPGASELVFTDDGARGGGWRAFFTGRTMVDAIEQGEYRPIPFLKTFSGVL